MERLVQAEPDQADYQRNLSVSYDRVGDVYQDLGQGEKARDAYQKALRIRERLAKAEPDRADYQVDLVNSLYRVGIAGDSSAHEPIKRALEILRTLQEERRLAPQHEFKIPALREALNAEGIE